MKIAWMILLCLCCNGSIALADDFIIENEVILAAENWLKLVDGGDYDRTWNETSNYLKNRASKKQLIEILQANRVPLGKVVSRKVIEKKSKIMIPGAPTGKYVSVKFRTTSDQNKSIIEEVTMMFEKGNGWRVAGYYVL